MKSDVSGVSAPKPADLFLPFSFLLIFILLALYSVSLGHNFLFDEENIIIRNPYIKGFARLPELFSHGFFYLEEGLKAPLMAYYRPLTSFSFMVDYYFWGVNPLGFNLTSVFCHALVCILLLKFLWMTLRDGRAAFLGTLIFAVHAVHTDSINQISGRGTILAAFFILGVLILYLKSKDAPGWLLFVLAVLSKESAILVPAILFFLDICFIRTKPMVLVKRLLPFFAIAALYVVFRKTFCPAAVLFESEPVLAKFLRVLSMGPAILRYLKALLMPGSFGFFGSVEFVRNFSDRRVLLTCLIGAAVIFGFIRGLRTRGAGFFAFALFWVGLLPFMQAVHFYPEWAEHYLYIPAMGFAMGVACLVTLANRRQGRFWPTLALAACLAFSFFLSLRTWNRNELYKDLPRYYETLAKSDSPYAVFGYHQLARQSLQEKDPERAIALLEKALSLKMNLSLTHTLFGQAYLMKDRPEEALSHYLLAARHAEVKTPYWISAAAALMKLEKYDEAEKLLQDAQKESPRYYLIYRSLMNVEELVGRPEESMRWFQRGLSAVSGNRRESAILRLAALRLLYRQGPRETFDAQLGFILKKDSDLFWYGDVARLLSGEIDPPQFSKIAQEKYPEFLAEASEYLLIAYVLHRNPDALKLFMDEHLKTFEERAAKDALFKIELEKAKQFLAGQNN
jgi:tetratricopeptide (TPR) repeat protein